MKRVVITINRQYGSGGKTIGYMLAEKLGIPCYSREILQRASEESGINESMFNARDERLKRLPKFLLSTNVYSGELLPPESKEFTSDQNLFNYEAEIIKKYAAEGSCVLIGRCADFVLKDDPDMISVYVHADHDFQMKSALERVSMSKKRWRNTSNEPTNTVQTSIIITQEEAGMMQKIMTCASTAENLDSRRQ